MQVFKFGGTSVGSAEAIRAALAHVCHAAPRVTVVVSAMSGITDLLLAGVEAAGRGEASAMEAATEAFRTRHLGVANALLRDSATALAGEIDAASAGYHARCREVATRGELTVADRDAAVAPGERLLARIFAAALREASVPASAVDAAELIFAEHRLAALWPNFERCQAACEAVLFPLIASGKIAVVPGFIGSGPDGELLTLGRGGSDLTATLLGRALGAERVVLYKDVDGLMTADPRSVPDARVLSELHYREAAELAYYGAKVLHPRTLFPLMDRAIPLWVRNTFKPPGAPIGNSGTRIAADVAPSGYPVRALSAITGQALVALSGNGMLGVPGIAGRTFSALAAAGHSVSMISQASSESSICLVVPVAEASHAVRALRDAFAAELAAGLLSDLSTVPNVALLAVVGLGMRGQPGIAARTFGALGGEHLNVLAIAQGSSELNITVALHEADAPRALRALHREFQLDKLSPRSDRQGREASLTLLGFGQIGRALAQQIADQTGYLHDDRGLSLRCVAIADRTGVTVAEAGFTPAALRARRGQKAGAARASTRASVGDTMAQLAEKVWPLAWHQPVLVDLTAEETAPLLRTALGHGFHLVLANKKPLAIAQADFDDLFAQARERRLSIRYEATVGAGLPVLDTLAKLREAGDAVTSLLGCLSGTLGFLMTELEAGVAFSAAVARARELGYTEPDPREDLSGTDVGRKALILARTLGFKLDLADLQVRSLFPPELSTSDPDAFVRGLSALDAEYARRTATARDRRQVLRYVARLCAGHVTVGLEDVPIESPLGRLHGTDNQVALFTKRYAENPLVVTGPGAGADVTAAGVLNDILAIAKGGEL